MARSRSKSTHRETSTDEPPELVKKIAWLLKPKNWRQYWLAIVLAALIVVAYPVAKFITSHRTTISHIEKGKNVGHLPEENARRAITLALHDDDVEEVLRLLAELQGSSAKDDECRHAFDTFMKKEELLAAQAIVDQCWVGRVREEKLSEIKIAKQKTK